MTGDFSGGLKDFWSVYDGCHAEMEAVLTGPLEAHAKFGPLLATQPKEQRDAQSARSRETLAKAIEANDWVDYDIELREQGALYAGLGIGFRDWYDIVRLVARYMVPKLTAAFLAEPDRLIAALHAQGEFYDHAMAVIGEAYIERSEARLRASIAVIGDVAAQKQASQYARSLIEASLDPLVTISPEGKITDVNEGSITATGVPREKLVGTDFSDYFTEPEKAREGYQQVFAKGFVTDYPLTIRHKDGRLTDVFYNASVYRGAQGKVLGVFAAARDVTESKRVMKDFAETKNLLDNILQSSIKYSLIGKDLDHRILSWNEGAHRNYGYAAEEILGKNSEVLHTREDVQSGAVKKLLDSAYEKGLAEGEFMRVRQDGTRFAASVVVTRRNDAAGNPIGYLLMSSDISEKRQAEAQLRSASQYARSLIEASLDPLVTISPEGKITDVNEGSIKVTGAPREELIGTDFSDYFTEPERARAGYQQVFAKGFVTDYPLTIRHRSHRLTEVLYNASVYKDAQGKVLGVFAAARDVTAQKRAEAEIAEQRGKEFDRLAELERFQRLTVGRELKMIELKKEIEALKGTPRQG